MTRIPVYKVALVREGSCVGETRAVQAPADAAEVLRTYIGDSDREHFVVLLLSTRHTVNGLHTVSVGTLNSSVVHPREVFKAAILANAAAILVAHNHPSGDPDPSQEDLALTRRLTQAGEMLGVPVLDHIILGDPGFVSLKERGLL